jgi:hypothetical protein
MDTQAPKELKVKRTVQIQMEMSAVSVQRQVVSYNIEGYREWMGDEDRVSAYSAPKTEDPHTDLTLRNNQEPTAHSQKDPDRHLFQ